MSKRNSGGSINGKGYYIALILCAVAIGITGYLYYRNTNDTQQLQDQTSAVLGTDRDGDVQAVATQPEETESTEPSQQKDTRPAKRVSPVVGETVAEYAVETLSYNQTTRDWRVHNGIDIAAEAETPVCAAADGTVYTVYEDETMGMTVVIRHSGDYTTRYSSLAEQVAVKPGDAVTAGQTIGYVGTTALLETAVGDHVHFSVSCGNASVDPVAFLTQD